MLNAYIRHLLIFVFLLFSNLVFASSNTWTIIDNDSTDLSGKGVTVTCPDQSTKTLTKKSNSTTCSVSGNSTITFKKSASIHCTAHFDAGGNFVPNTSTCQPVTPIQSNTMVFSASQGIEPLTPPANQLLISFANETVTIGCSKAQCPNKSSIVGNTISLKNSLETNGAMTLSFSSSSSNTGSKETCNVVFYNQFIDFRQSTCINLTLTTIAQGFTSNTLAFPTSNKNGIIDKYPTAPASSTAGNLIGNRTITFENQCNQDVWFNLISGTVGSKKNVSNLCASSDAKDKTITCPISSTCRYVNQDQAYCFYDADDSSLSKTNPLEEFKLTALKKGSNPDTATIKTNVYDVNDIIFSGGASARIGCTDEHGNYQACAIGNCNPGDSAMACSYTMGTENGSTIAEFTFQKNAVDFYDISVINGAHIPVSMAISAGQTPDQSEKGSTVDQYWCTSPGATSGNDKRDCSWNFADNLSGDNQYYYVNVAYASATESVKLSDLNYCTSNSDCTEGVCGFSLDMVSLLSTTQQSELFTTKGANNKTGPFICGAALGYTTPVNACALLGSASDTADTYLKCNKALSQTSPAGGTVNLTYANLYSCNGKTDNCIKAKTDYAGTVCCGCTTWSDLDKGIESGQRIEKKVKGEYVFENQACTFDGGSKNTNNHWEGLLSQHKPKTALEPDVKGKIKFLKQACPTAYAYQFDDATSTFNCYVSEAALTDKKHKTRKKADPSTINGTDYTITFCPGGTNIQ